MTYDDVLLFNTKHQRKIIISFVELIFFQLTWAHGLKKHPQCSLLGVQGDSLGWFRKIPGFVSQHVWHDKDPFLHKRHKR